MIDFTKYKELEDQITAFQTELKKESIRLTDEKLKELGLKIGDKVVDSRDRVGILTTAYLSYSYRFNFSAKKIKKDGTPSQQNAYMDYDINELAKVES